MRKTKIFKKLAVLAAAGALAMSLTGCGGMTLEKLMVEVDAALADKEIQQGTIAIELDASVTSAGETQDIVADVILEAIGSEGSSTSYLDLDIDGDIAGESINETMQLYIQEEDGEKVGYSHMDSLDMWSKIDMTEPDTDTEADTTEFEMPADLALAEETQIVDNREAYVLTCTFTGEELMEDMGDMSEAEDALSEMGLGEMDLDLDLSSLAIPTTIYIDMETYIPIRVECDVQGLDEVLNDFMSSFTDSMLTGLTGLEGAEDLGVDMSELEADMGTADMDINVNTMKIVVNELGFDPVEIPTVSEEGKEAAELQEIINNQYTFEADQGDGTYIIQESGNAVRVSMPEGWTALDYSYDYVLASTEDGMQEVSYMMYTDMISEDFALYVEQVYVPAYIEQGVYVSHGIGPKIGEFETMYIEYIDGIMIYYAWAPVGDGWVDIELYDYEGNDIEEALTPIVEAVEEHQL